MKIEYAISLWNFFHYANMPSLERVIEHVREQGYGIELWGRYGDESDLYGPVGVKRLQPLVAGMHVTLHKQGESSTLDMHKKQIDAAAALGAGVIVMHPNDFYSEGRTEFNQDLASDAVEYASEYGVMLALENGPLEFLVEAISKVDDLRICIDTGHIYNAGKTMAEYLDKLKHRLIHLHLQDVVTTPEKGLPLTGNDHYIPGTGGTPSADWRLLYATLKEIDFEGTAAFEIRPRNPFQTTVLARENMEAMASDPKEANE